MRSSIENLKQMACIAVGVTIMTTGCGPEAPEGGLIDDTESADILAGYALPDINDNQGLLYILNGEAEEAVEDADTSRQACQIVANLFFLTPPLDDFEYPYNSNEEEARLYITETNSSRMPLNTQATFRDLTCEENMISLTAYYASPNDEGSRRYSMEFPFSDDTYYNHSGNEDRFESPPVVVIEEDEEAYRLHSRRTRFKEEQSRCNEDGQCVVVVEQESLFVRPKDMDVLDVTWTNWLQDGSPVITNYHLELDFPVCPEGFELVNGNCEAIQ